MNPTTRMALEAIVKQWPMLLAFFGLLAVGQYRLSQVEETVGQQTRQISTLTELVHQNAVSIARLQEVVRIQAGTWAASHQRGGGGE